MADDHATAVPAGGVVGRDEYTDASAVEKGDTTKVNFDDAGRQPDGVVQNRVEFVAYSPVDIAMQYQATAALSY